MLTKQNQTQPDDRLKGRIVLWHRLKMLGATIVALYLLGLLLFIFVIARNMIFGREFLLSFLGVAAVPFVAGVVLLVAGIAKQKRAQLDLEVYQVNRINQAAKEAGPEQAAELARKNAEIEIEQLRRKAASAKSLSAFGLVLMSVYVLSTLSVFLGGSAEEWGAAGGLSLFLLAPLLIAGGIIWVIGVQRQAYYKDQERKVSADSSDHTPGSYQ